MIPGGGSFGRQAGERQRPPLIIGLTGPIGCGKTAVAARLQALGGWVIDADDLAREVTAPGRPALAEIRRRFGDLVLGEDTVDVPDAVFAQLERTGATLATAESCTGGLIAKRLTDAPGSSAYFVGGVVAYSNQVKSRLLGVDPHFFPSFGAVSEEVAMAMAEGAKRSLGADCAISVTGIAGPSGATPEKPVGLVYIGTLVDDRVEVRSAERIDVVGCYGDELGVIRGDGNLEQVGAEVRAQTQAVNCSNTGDSLRPVGLADQGQPPGADECDARHVAIVELVNVGRPRCACSNVRWGRGRPGADYSSDGQAIIADCDVNNFRSLAGVGAGGSRIKNITHSDDCMRRGDGVPLHNAGVCGHR